LYISEKSSNFALDFGRVLFYLYFNSEVIVFIATLHPRKHKSVSFAMLQKSSTFALETCKSNPLNMNFGIIKII